MTQARDVFDLGILIRGGHLAEAAKQGSLPPLQIRKAINRLLELDWDDYQGQVVEYLDAESRAEFGTHKAWEALQMRVFESLNAHV